MSSSPAFDPYLVLGLDREADIRKIRRAYRERVLKYHPDRIREGDDEDVEHAREEFQKVQEAYELLTDEARRSRYDDKVELAEQRKQAHGREPPVRSPIDPTRTHFSATREYDYRDGHYYEKRVPKSTTFFKEEGRYREEPPRASAREGDNYERKRDNYERKGDTYERKGDTYERKGDTYERKGDTYERKGDNHERERQSYERKGDRYERKTSSARTEKKSAAWTAAGLSSNLAQKLQKEAANARERTNLRAANAKVRDQERRRNATDKQSSRRAFVEDCSSSDSDTVTYDNVNKNAAKASSASYPPRASNTGRPRRGEANYTDDDDDDYPCSTDKHQEWHASACDYIQRSGASRPREVPRQDSSHSYFEPRDDKSYARRSGSDREDRRSERDRTKSAGPRRPSYSEVELPRDLRSRKVPKMTQATSAPANIKIPEERRAPPPPHRSRTMQAVRDHRPDMPPLSRSNTMPVSGSARRSDNIAPRGSNLKHGETQDSGYGSSSPATPDMHGTSPTKYSATRYQIVDDAEEFCRGPRTILVDPEDSGRRTRSPLREQQQRPGLSTSGKRPSRTATAYIPSSPIDGPPSRPMPSRHESLRYTSQARETSHWGSSHRERKPLYREVSSDEQDGGYTHRVSTEKAAPRAQDAHYATSHRVARDGARDEDYYPGSNYRSELRNPGMGGTRPPVC